MLRRHLGIPVYDDSRALKCSHCSSPMDALGDHAADLCRKGYGWGHRHKVVVSVFGREVFSAAGFRCNYEVPLLVPGTLLRPADILVDPPPPAPGENPGKPTAYDVTIVSPFKTGMITQVAKKPGAAVEAAHSEKRNKLIRKVRSRTITSSSGPVFVQPFIFQPLAFDSLGTPSEASTKIISDHAKKIAQRSSCSFSTAKARIEQRISCAIWTCNATAIISRAPIRVVDLEHPVRV